MAVDSAILEQMKPWMHRNLGNLDLDVNDMVEYVVTLLSAPNSIEELHQNCISELQDLMGPATKPFVDSLFVQITNLQQEKENPTASAPSEPATGAPAPETDSTLSQTSQSEHDAEQQRSQRDYSMDKVFQPSQRQQAPFDPQQFANQQQFGQQPAPFGDQIGQMQQMAQQMQQFERQLQEQGVAPPPGAPQFPPPQFPAGFGFKGFSGNQQQQPGYPNRQHHNNFHHQNKPYQQRRNKFSNISSVHNELSVANKKLVVEGIPPEYLNADAVKQYFQRFGEVEVLKVDENHKLAEIEFAGHDMALAAHQSPEPIFGNRFVKVFWRRKDDTGAEPEPELDVDAVRRMQAIKQQQFEEKEQKREQLTQELNHLFAEQTQLIEQRKQMILSGQITPEWTAQAQEHTQNLTNRVAELKHELSALNSPTNTGSTRGAFRGGAFRGRGASPYGRGGFRGRGGPVRGGGMRGGMRGGAVQAFKNASIDRRPKSVLLQNVGTNMDESLREMLASRRVSDINRRSDSEVLIDFEDRKSAEDFVNASNSVEGLSGAEKHFVRNESNTTNEDSSANEAMTE